MMRQRTIKGASLLVIQKTDFLILTVASMGLAVGIFRWHYNTHNVDTVTIPASSTIAIAAPEMPPEPTNAKVSLTSPSNELPANVTQTLTAAPAANQYQEYIVQSGDSLSKLAVKYDTDVSTLQLLNNIAGTVIQVGQTIAYPSQPKNN